MTSKIASSFFTVILLLSKHIAAMEFPFPAPEPAESVEWFDDAPDIPLVALANPRMPRSDDGLEELKRTQPKPSRQQRTSWRMPRVRMSRGQVQLLTLALLACGATAALDDTYDPLALAKSDPLAMLGATVLGQAPICPKSHVLAENLAPHQLLQFYSKCMSRCIDIFLVKPIEAYILFDGSTENCALGCASTAAKDFLQCAVPGT